MKKSLSEASGTILSEQIEISGRLNLHQRPAIMLMAPDYQVEEVWDERLWDETCWTALGSILVKHQDVEPLPARKVKVLEMLIA